MANHKSAIKRIRQTARRSERNTASKSRLRTQIKAFHSASAAQDKDQVGALVTPTTSMVDKAVQKGILHRNKANRIKSSLARAANKAAAA